MNDSNVIHTITEMIVRRGPNKSHIHNLNMDMSGRFHVCNVYLLIIFNGKPHQPLNSWMKTL